MFFLDWFKGSSKGYKRNMMKREYTPRKILDWQQRENKVWSKISVSDKDIGDPLYVIRSIQRDMFIKVRYKRDEGGDFWDTSDNIIKNLEDDCDGQAIYIWAKMRLAGFPDEQIGMTIVTDHMFAVWFDPSLSNDFYIIDNGWIIFVPKKASEVFPHRDMHGNLLEPYIGFNTNSWWTYSKK